MAEVSVTPIEATDIETRHGIGVFALRGITLVRGEGAVVWDDRGRSYIDCTSAHGVAVLGHCHPAVVAAIREQAGRLMNCTGIFANDQRAALMQELAALLPAGMDRFFFCNSGAEAVEAALKIARVVTSRRGVVAARGGFHGRTMGALSATWEPHYRKPFEPLVRGFRHVRYNDPAALDRALTDDVGAVLLEVVQGEGGVRLGDPTYLQTAQALCRERGALFILDEVQTGFGRTGRMFALEHYGLEPDIVCLGKGIAGGFPMGAVALGPRVQNLAVGQHGSTFGGNPLACAAARAALRTLQGENLPQQAAEKGAYLLERLRDLQKRKRLVREVRGLGLMVGVELRVKVAPFLQALQERGVLAINAGPTVLRLLPPLVIGYDQLDRVVAALDEVLN
ncbi:[LysW]-aminoadipate semialdehyde transaminase [bacterium HR11]|nr:[LysW]-aminoadipate semialdehyde transaminase [bacterium HR11]